MTAQTLIASVGPARKITLMTPTGAKVVALEAGAYVFVVHDRSRLHNFRLQELAPPGARHLERSTRVRFVGTVRWAVTLRTGSYAYRCDVHSLRMHGSFKVS